MNLEPLVVAFSSSIRVQRCDVCLGAIAALETYITVRDSTLRHRLHGACAASADDPELRRFGRRAAAYERERAA